MNNFSLSDYIFRHAYRLNNARGKAETDAVAKALGGSRISNKLLNPFSLRALTSGTDSGGGYTKANLVAGDAFQNFYEHSIFMTFGTVLTGLKSDITLDAKNIQAVLTDGAVTENQANTFSTNERNSIAKNYRCRKIPGRRKSASTVLLDSQQ